MRLNPASLRRIREDRGWSISELSRRAEVARSHISNIENGNRPPSADVIVKLATALEVSPYALLGPEDPLAAMRELVELLHLTAEDIFPTMAVSA